MSGNELVRRVVVWEQRKLYYEQQSWGKIDWKGPRSQQSCCVTPKVGRDGLRRLVRLNSLLRTCSNRLGELALLPTASSLHQDTLCNEDVKRRMVERANLAVISSEMSSTCPFVHPFATIINFTTAPRLMTSEARCSEPADVLNARQRREKAPRGGSTPSGHETAAFDRRKPVFGAVL